MKSFLKFSLPILIVLTVMLFFESCQKLFDSNKIDGEYYITNEMRELVPFQGGEKAHFIVDDSIKIVMEAGERKGSTIEVPIGTHTSHYEIREYETILFQNENYYLRYELMGIHFAKRRPLLYVQCNPGYKSAEVDYFVPLPNDENKYLDSLFVLNRWIKDVYIAEDLKYQYQPQEYADTVYYSPHYGIIKVISKEGGDWELEKIEW